MVLKNDNEYGYKYETQVYNFKFNGLSYCFLQFSSSAFLPMIDLLDASPSSYQIAIGNQVFLEGFYA